MVRGGEEFVCIEELGCVGSLGVPVVGELGGGEVLEGNSVWIEVVVRWW